MPELPEVEATVVYLRERVVGRRIIGGVVGWRRSVGSADFEHLIIGGLIVGVRRRGKFFLIDLTYPMGKRVLVGHLRMSGQMDVVAADSPRGSHDRVVLGLDDGREVRFSDPRKFGRLRLVEDELHVTRKLGVEPLSSQFTEKFLLGGLSRSRRMIKPLLLDQTFIAGLGNIYVDEVLWESRIHPQQESARIPPQKVGVLATAIPQVLRAAIAASGTDFGDGVVPYGGFTPKVYGRSGDPCLRCGTRLRRIVVGQRGTHLCPRCQVFRGRR